MYSLLFVMATECLSSSGESYSPDMQRLLRTASQQPWGPGREIDAKVHDLHQKLVTIQSRLGSAEEKPEDLELAHTIDHDLRNKLMIYQYHEGKRENEPKPRTSQRSSRPKALTA
jgi:hypothetical protein